MTERDFAYWLQGFFEISGEARTLSSSQIACVRRHIALLRTTQKTSVLATSIDALIEHNVEAVQRVINEYFEHVIDPQHPNQAAANYAHHGNSSVKVRC